MEKPIYSNYYVRISPSSPSLLQEFNDGFEYKYCGEVRVYAKFSKYREGVVEVWDRDKQLFRVLFFNGEEKLKEFENKRKFELIHKGRSSSTYAVSGPFILSGFYFVIDVGTAEYYTGTDQWGRWFGFVYWIHDIVAFHVIADRAKREHYASLRVDKDYIAIMPP